MASAPTLEAGFLLLQGHLVLCQPRFSVFLVIVKHGMQAIGWVHPKVSLKPPFNSGTFSLAANSLNRGHTQNQFCVHLRDVGRAHRKPLPWEISCAMDWTGLNFLSPEVY